MITFKSLQNFDDRSWSYMLRPTSNGYLTEIFKTMFYLIIVSPCSFRTCSETALGAVVAQLMAEQSSIKTKLQAAETKLQATETKLQAAETKLQETQSEVLSLKHAYAAKSNKYSSQGDHHNSTYVIILTPM